MNRSIADWNEYCEGSTQFEDEDFIGLLWEQRADDELDIIFQRVPFKQAVIERLKRVYRGARDGYVLQPRCENSVSSDNLLPVLLAFLESQRRYLLKCDIRPHTKTWFERTDLAVSFRTEKVDRPDPGEDMRMQIWEEEYQLFRFRPETEWEDAAAGSVEERVLAGIQEALYGLACNHYVAWYILAPLTESEIEYDLYLDFWLKGGEYALTDSEIVFGSIWDT